MVLWNKKPILPVIYKYIREMLIWEHFDTQQKHM
jgi:hypothetical protein